MKECFCFSGGAVGLNHQSPRRPSPPKTVRAVSTGKLMKKWKATTSLRIQGPETPGWWQWCFYESDSVGCVSVTSVYRAALFNYFWTSAISLLLMNKSCVYSTKWIRPHRWPPKAWALLHSAVAAGCVVFQWQLSTIHTLSLPFVALSLLPLWILVCVCVCVCVWGNESVCLCQCIGAYDGPMCSMQSLFIDSRGSLTV